MAVTFQAVGTAVSATTGTLSPAWPTHQADDFALLFVTSSAGGTTTLSTPNGFTLARTTPTTGTGTAGTQLSVYWARATSSSMAAPVLTAGTDFKYAVIATWRGVSRGFSPLAATGTRATAGTSLPMAVPSTYMANMVVVYGISTDLDSASASHTSTTGTGLTSITERFDAGTIDGTGGGIAIIDALKASAGTSSSFTTTATTSSLAAYYVITLEPDEGYPVTFVDNFSTNTSANYTAGIAGSIATHQPIDFSMLMQRSPASTGAGQMYRDISALTVGKQYRVTARALSGNSDTGSGSLGVNGIGTGTAQTYALTSNPWVLLSYDFTATATTHRVEINYATNGATATIVKIDDLRILELPGAEAYTGSANLAGSGTLTGAVKPGPNATPALNGDGNLTASGTPKPVVAVPLTGSGSLTTSVTAATNRATTLSGSGSLTASTGTPAAPGTATLGGSGTLSAPGKPTVAQPTTLTGSGTLTAVGLAAADAAGFPALTGAGTLTTIRTIGTRGTPNLTGTGTLNSSATVFTNDFLGFANLNGTGALATTAKPGAVGTAPLTGSGTLSTLAAPLISSGVQFTGTGTLTAVLSPALARLVQFTGNGALTTVGVAVVPRNVTVTGTLLARRWDAELTTRNKTGALVERDNTGTLLERTNTGTLTPRRWEAELD